MSEDTGWIETRPRTEHDDAVWADLRDRWQNLSDEEADAVFFGLLEMAAPGDARAVFVEVEAYGAAAYLRRLGLT